MGQQVWIMDSITGEHYTLGLYHGEDSGNVLIYLNNEIFLIDYKIFEYKTYNFFIGNEFMKLTIQKIKEDFEYLLEVDKETPTPLNSAIKKQEKEEQNFQLFGLIFICLVLVALFIYNYYARYRH